MESGALLARLGFHPVIQNATMTFSSFVETKFIPEHVQHKTLAGRTHYQAMLKHLIRPETVHRMFNQRTFRMRGYIQIPIGHTLTRSGCAISKPSMCAEWSLRHSHELFMADRKTH